MRTVYLKISLYIVIEQPQIPGDRVMAGFAIALKDTVVVVVLQVAVDTGIAGVREALRRMTIGTFNVAVLAQQRKGRQVMLKERRVFPIGLCVTVTALFAKLAVMWVIIKVTRHTVVAGRQLENRLDMAVVTGNRFVCAVKQELSRTVVIKGGLGPGFGRMAQAAIGAAMPGVAVIFQVTADAGHIHDIIKRVFAVAVGTGQTCVLAFERKVGVAGVVEACVSP